MYEMPLTFLFGGWGFEVGESIFCTGVLGVGIWSLAFCPEILSARTASQQPMYIVMLAY